MSTQRVQRSNPQGADGIDAGIATPARSAAGGKEAHHGGFVLWRTGDQGDHCHDDEGGAECERIARTDVVEQIAHQPREHESDDRANDYPGNCQSQPARNNQSKEIFDAGAEPPSANRVRVYFNTAW